jgi:RalA-binding protein 1
MQLFKRKDKKLTKQNSRSDSADRNNSGSQIKPVLGVPLKTAVANSKCYDGIPVPALVRNCIDYVEENGLDVEGIYRVSAFISRLDELERLANSGGNITFLDPHDAAGLLKRFLRQLPDHIFQFPSYIPARFESVAETCKCPFEKPCKCEVVLKLKEMLLEAPKENFYLLAYVFIHAHHVIEKGTSKMTLGALGVLLQAMLSVSKNIIRIFILNAIPSTYNADPSNSTVYFFDKVPFKRYSPPLTSEQITSNPPENLTALENEIFKQQNLLEEINDQVLELRKQNIDTKQKEHEMWECQHSITFLKRKVKTFTRDNIKGDGDEEASISTETELTNICESGPILEKQLLAIQNSLIEEIAEEQRQIAELTNRLHELQQDISINLLSQKTTSINTPNPVTPRPKMAPPPPPQAPIYDPAVVNATILTDSILEENDPSCDECHRQEARKKALLENISKVRDECAQYRGKLEDSRECAIDAADDFGNSNVLVTKF